MSPLRPARTYLKKDAAARSPARGGELRKTFSPGSPRHNRPPPRFPRAIAPNELSRSRRPPDDRALPRARSAELAAALPPFDLEAAIPRDA
ncbi:MAG: hypothetical protein B6A08_20530 [Sorangiineae bacterium NIC37A_2]|nr:MAG: hypothetical protein B6A08_20530 [Sorangiineae bacterium NIC37A_2]